MQVIYERCAAVDVGKDVIVIAVRGPGKEPDGRVTVKRQYKTFYGVLREAARWLVSEGVTHVAMEATGIIRWTNRANWTRPWSCCRGRVRDGWRPGPLVGLVTDRGWVLAAAGLACGGA
jgi:hypothetical protein